MIHEADLERLRAGIPKKARSQIMVRVSPEFREEFKEWCEERGVTMTAVLLFLMKGVMGGDDDVPEG
jgi:hypothetical protein